MRIAIFTDSYLPSINGVVTHVVNLTEGLRKKGHVVHVYCPSYPGYRESDEKVKRYSSVVSSKAIEKRLGLELDGRVMLPGNFSKFDLSDYDIFHSHHFFAVGMIAARYSQKLKIPLVFTNHTNYYNIGLCMSLGGLFIKTTTKRMSYYSKFCKCIISPGEKMRQILLNLGVKSEIRVIPNGIESAFSELNSIKLQRLKTKFKLKEEATVLMYVGRLSLEKNIAFLLKGLLPLFKYNIKLMLVGDGPLKRLINNFIEDHKLQDKIFMTGFIKHSNIKDYYGLADIFVTSSITEVFPLTLLEAMSCCVPVVGINAPGTGDIIEHEINGLLSKNNLSDFRRKVLQLINNEELRKKLGNNAKGSVTKYSIENSVERHIVLYNEFA